MGADTFGDQLGFRPIPTDEQGTRHRTADRVSKQAGFPVVSVSKSMNTIALYVAGNRNTLLSLWPVVDESTALFMTEFFRRLRAGESQVQALNAVKRGFVTDPERRFTAALFWAPFILYGS